MGKKVRRGRGRKGQDAVWNEYHVEWGGTCLFTGLSVHVYPHL